MQIPNTTAKTGNELSLGPGCGGTLPPLGCNEYVMMGIVAIVA